MAAELSDVETTFMELGAELAATLQHKDPRESCPAVGDMCLNHTVEADYSRQVSLSRQFRSGRVDCWTCTDGVYRAINHILL